MKGHMRILHVTDLHFNQHHFEWIKAKQDQYDVLCFTGDFLDHRNSQETPSRLDVDKDNMGDHGCDFIRIALESNTLKPSWILSGHIHQPKRTIVRLGEISISNPGNGRMPIPKYNVIEIS
jgi:Icc-related predicted phosphoesterase